MKENEPIVGEVKVVVVGPGILTREQGTAHTKLINFFWDLTLAAGRIYDDPALSPEQKAVVCGIIEMSADDAAQKGESLWQAWITSGGHKICPAHVTQDNMQQLLKSVNIARMHHHEMLAFRSKIADRY